MQLIHNFGVSIEQYVSLGRSNKFPTPDRCPCCRAKGTVRRHGFYERNALFDKDYRVLIIRYICHSCRKTISLLPSFLLPRFQHSVRYIFHCLKETFIYKRLSTYRQKAAFYKKRYLKNMNLVESFFRILGYRGKIPGKPHKKATKLVEMVTLVGAETFAKRFNDHFNINFMAN